MKDLKNVNGGERIRGRARERTNPKGKERSKRKKKKEGKERTKKTRVPMINEV